MARGTARIIITQDGLPGPAGISRDDLELAVSVLLSNESNTGVTSWRWEFVDVPTGSAATLGSPHASTCAFTPDVEGSYLVQLTVNQGIRGQVARSLCVVRDSNGLRIPAFEETDEANWDIDGIPNTRGWLPDVEAWIQELASSGVTDHGALTGLGDDDHTQYLLVSGARAMSGALDMGAQQITNVGNVDGVDVSGHAARHLPGGADALTTATPVALGTSLSEGSAASFARSDHVHTVPNSTLDATTLYEVDFGSLANNALSGTESLDGRPWTIVNETNSTLFEIVNGSGSTAGMHWDASTTNTAYTGASQTGTRAVISWANLLGSDFDPMGEYIIDVHVGSHTLGVANNFFFVGMLQAGTAASSAAGVQLLNNAGTVQLRYSTLAASGGAITAGTNDVISIRVSALEVYGYCGVYSSGWPANSALTWLGQGGVSGQGNASVTSYMQNNGPSSNVSAFVMVTSTGETGGTMDLVVRRMRVRRIR